MRHGSPSYIPPSAVRVLHSENGITHAMQTFVGSEAAPVGDINERHMVRVIQACSASPRTGHIAPVHVSMVHNPAAPWS